jgi:hypothetical protein
MRWVSETGGEARYQLSQLGSPDRSSQGSPPGGIQLTANRRDGPPRDAIPDGSALDSRVPHVAVPSAASVRRTARRRRNAWLSERAQLRDRQVDAEVAEVRLRLATAQRRRFRHDLINAFAAVDCAAILLAKETLTSRDRATLVDLLGSGLQGLRTLLMADPNEDGVDLAELMKSNGQEPGWPDVADVDVAPALVITGDAGEIAEAIRLVVTHASGRASATRATVRGGRNANRVELWVEDRGPQLTPQERRDLLHPDLRRSTGAVFPGGIDVAIRLVRGQGGEVKVDARPDGGESFGISWPMPVG